MSTMMGDEAKITRRTFLGAGACAAAAIGPILHADKSRAASRFGLDSALSATNLDSISRYYAAWEQKTWRPFDLLLTEDFTFTSPNNDDHISKSEFKERCWKSQVNYIKGFDLKHVAGHGEEAFVMYLCQTSNGKSFQNVEYLRMKTGRILSIECYFGATSSFASAVSEG